jgi:hypothetical protein
MPAGTPTNAKRSSSDELKSTPTPCHPEGAESSALPRTPNEGPMQVAPVARAVAEAAIAALVARSNELTETARLIVV